MRITKVIEELEKILKEKGNLEVVDLQEIGCMTAIFDGFRIIDKKDSYALGYMGMSQDYEFDQVVELERDF
jgi:hypothetical protein